MAYEHFIREDFIQQAAGSEAIAKEIVGLFHRDMAKDLMEIEAAFSSENYETVRRLAHKAKSGFIIMGANSLFELARQIETRAKQGETDLEADLSSFRIQCEGLDRELCAEFEVS